MQPTTPATLDQLTQQECVYDAGYDALKLQRKRDIYGVLYQRLQDVLHLDDEGCEVTITLRGATKTLTLSAAEVAECFNLGDIYGVLGNRLEALHKEIMGLLTGKKTPAMEGTDEDLMRQALALCLPQHTNATEPAA